MPRRKTGVVLLLLIILAMKIEQVIYDFMAKINKNAV